ncbi:MAG: formylglycine-generating enzyme family protein [Bacteroidales bacterium]|nr:formylglycine-generating enzyme family protein [Bacteroidales bacterium]
MKRLLVIPLFMLATLIAVAQDVTFQVGKISFKMIHIVGGTFKMGATSEQVSEAEPNEFPVHRVTLSDFYLGETEVTQELWEAVMGKNPSFFVGNSKRPVENVSWIDCQTFLRRLNDLLHKNGQLNNNQTFTLPTEAQWEYAARGGNKSKHLKYAGSNSIGSVAWFYYSKGVTHSVGLKMANELGLYDMSGNVFEWCADWYTPWELADNEMVADTARVLRGGSWSSPSKKCRISNRFCQQPDTRAGNFGLRLALVEE